MSETHRKNCAAGPYTEWLEVYNEDVLPLRSKADEGEGSYSGYDEAYNEHLEGLHDLVREDAVLLDNAQEMASFVAGIAGMTADFEMAAEDAIECMNALIIMARKIRAATAGGR